MPFYMREIWSTCLPPKRKKRKGFLFRREAGLTALPRGLTVCHVDDPILYLPVYCHSALKYAPRAVNFRMVDYERQAARWMCGNAKSDAHL